MKILISTVLVLQVIWAVSGSVEQNLDQNVDDYYWRDFNGLVTWDAVPGGTTKDEKDKTFIGQFNIPRGDKIDSVPAIITKGSPHGRAAYHGARQSPKDSNLKILCSSNLSRFKWYSPTAQVAPGCHYVRGGLELDIPVYIGRGKTDNQYLIGKVASNDNPMKLRAAADNGQEPTFWDFEILTYCY